MVVSQKKVLLLENQYEWSKLNNFKPRKTTIYSLYFKGTVAYGTLEYWLKPDLSCEPAKEKWCCIRSLSGPGILEPSILHPGQDFSI